MTNESAIVQSVPVESEAKQVEHRDGRAVITLEKKTKKNKRIYVQDALGKNTYKCRVALHAERTL